LIPEEIKRETVTRENQKVGKLNEREEENNSNKNNLFYCIITSKSLKCRSYSFRIIRGGPSIKLLIQE